MSFRYVALGDSQSEGIGDLPHPDGSQRGWTDRLAQILAREHAGLQYANLAVRGLRAQQILDSQVPAARLLEPDLVTISAGGNDLPRPGFSRERLHAAISDMVQQLTADGAQVLLLPAPPIARLMPLGRWCDLLEERIEIMNQVLDAVSREHSAVVPANLSSALFSDSRFWAADRIHFSQLGHECVAYGVAATLGLSARDGWDAPLAGVPTPRTVTTEVGWLVSNATPWVVRRIRGRSAGEGRVAKRPSLGPMR